jgi:hypothetical protein
MYEPNTSHAGVSRPARSISSPATWRLPDSVTRLTSGSVLRSLSLVERNTATRVEKRPSSDSKRPPTSTLIDFSGGVSTFCALSE